MIQTRQATGPQPSRETAHTSRSAVTSNTRRQVAGRTKDRNTSTAAKEAIDKEDRTSNVTTTEARGEVQGSRRDRNSQDRRISSVAEPNRRVKRKLGKLHNLVPGEPDRGGQEEKTAKTGKRRSKPSSKGTHRPEVGESNREGRPAPELSRRESNTKTRVCNERTRESNTSIEAEFEIPGDEEYQRCRRNNTSTKAETETEIVRGGVDQRKKK